MNSTTFFRLFLASTALCFLSSSTLHAAPPIFDPIGEEFWISSVVYATEGERVEFTVTAVDPDGDDVTLSAETLPPWAEFNAATGVFSGIPPLWSDDYETRRNQPGKFDVTFMAADGTYTVEKKVVVTVLEEGWTPRTMADIVASRPILSGGDPGTPVEIRDVVDDTIRTPFAEGKQIRRISFGFTSQIPDVSGWETDWVADLNHAYLPLEAPAVENVGAIVEGSYAQSWGDSALAMQACAELDIPVLIIDVDWEFSHGGDVMSRHNEKTVLERAPEYIFYTFSSAHYMRALDALVTVIDSLTSWPVSFEDFRGVFTGHSKFGHTCLAAASLDTHRVVGYMSSGSAGLYTDAYRLLAAMLGESELNPESSPNYLGTIMKYYTEPLKLQFEANPNLKADLVQGTRDGIKFNTLCTEHSFELPHRMGTVPNLIHSTQSPHHSIIWRMWLAHCFLGRPISAVSSVSHYRDGESLVVEATVSGSPEIRDVVLFVTDEPDTEPGSWNTVVPFPMEKQGEVYRREIPVTSTMYFVEVHDSADGVDGIVSSVPTPVNRDYPLLRLPPGGVTDLSAIWDGSDVHLSWSNPVDDDFAGVIIRWDSEGYPQDPTAGTRVYDGDSTAFTHVGVGGEETCYYSAFAYDAMGNYAESDTTFVDTTSAAPDVPEGFIYAWPNPFSGSCEIRFRLERPAEVSLQIADVSGRIVETLLDGQTLEAGVHPVIWDAENLAAGSYFVRLRIGDQRITRKTILVR